MAYNPNFALTNAQMRDQGLQGALENFMGYFQTVRKQKDEAEKAAALEEVSRASGAAQDAATGAPRLGMDPAGMPTGLKGAGVEPGQAAQQHLADVKARYLNKYGAMPATGQDMLAADLEREDKIAGFGDNRDARAAKKAQQGKVEAIGATVKTNPDMDETQKAFYGAFPDKLADIYKPQPLQAVQDINGNFVGLNRFTGKTPDGKTVTGKLPKAEKSLAEIEAEAKARAEGAASGAKDKPLSGDAAKLTGFVTTLVTQGNTLKKMIQDNGIRKVVYEYKKGNPAFVNVIEDVADAKGRLRSGGAVNREEADRFKQPFSGLGSLVYGDNKAALDAIDAALDEAGNVKKGMGHNSPGAEAPAGTAPKLGDTKTNAAGTLRFNGSVWERVK